MIERAGNGSHRISADELHSMRERQSQGSKT